MARRARAGGFTKARSSETPPPVRPAEENASSAKNEKAAARAAAKPPRGQRGLRRLVVVPLWLALLAVLLLLLLALWLYTTVRERRAEVRVRDVEKFEEALSSIAGLTGGAILSGNRATVLQDGDQFFPALLADIAAARETIHLETYVWWKGEICERVGRALAARARRGVEVRLTLDAMGATKMNRRLLALMRDAGVEINRYHPIKFSELGLINQRTHRKLAVFDGRVGYLFGHGIAEEWVGHGQDPEHWRDTGVRLEGPVVNSVQAVFADNWLEQTGEALVGPLYFPRLASAGSLRAHIVASKPRGGVSTLETLFKIAVASSRRELLIQNPYFIPDDEAVELLGRAVKRGVDVRIMLPGPVTDSSVVRHAGHFYWENLMMRGVRIYEYQRTLLHQKVVVVDGLWSLVGSTNLDDRSLDINDEASVGLIDRGIAAELKRAFAEDLRHCREIHLAEWRRRSLWDKGIDAMSYSINGQL
jgi:cardiolipin synthase A/B